MPSYALQSSADVLRELMNLSTWQGIAGMAAGLSVDATVMALLFRRLPRAS